MAKKDPINGEQLSISQALKDIKQSVFFEGKLGKYDPKTEHHHNTIAWGRVFAETCAAILADRGMKFSQATLDVVGKHINLSSFQRAVHVERDYRDGAAERPIPKLKNKAKIVTRKRPNPIDGGMRKRVDPITGEPLPPKKVKAKKPAAPKKEAKEAKPKKVAAPKAKKPAAPKKTGPKPAPIPEEADPITGEPEADTTELQVEV